MENVKLSNVKEREITKKNGFAMLFANILGYVSNSCDVCTRISFCNKL